MQKLSQSSDDGDCRSNVAVVALSTGATILYKAYSSTTATNSGPPATGCPRRTAVHTTSRQCSAEFVDLGYGNGSLTKLTEFPVTSTGMEVLQNSQQFQVRV